ncbi:MAG: iron-sulfur cluster carrier protein ApbC [Alteromonadaceae bacterium]|nr:iron-sulfur cluster carrier protein ApbC [Alteromonadaceae bacterium]
MNKSTNSSSDDKLTPENEADTGSNSVQDIILDNLQNYRSALFVDSILTICLSHQIKENHNGITVDLVMPFPCIGELSILAETLSENLKCKVIINVELAITPIRKHELNNISNIIAIASGKGGVGKSTTAVNLAYALMAEGASVGILDADIYGPSIPTLLGLKGIKPTSNDGKLLTPLNAQGLHAMSIGFLVAENDATVWRGPMASSAFNQLLNETAWPKLDYLIVDMPPGTGDIQLTLAQKVPVAGAVIITTPQDLALADAIKGIAMFEKVKVPVLGVIENMSYHLCENCGHQSALFGQGGGEDIATQYNTRLLGELPLDIVIRQDADLGQSCLIENSTSDLAQVYRRIARKLGAELYNKLDARSPQTAEIAIKVL